ncbi:G5 domain-containing protein [Leifsonia sp. NPDC077715]|uniref:G5 domain-containing protein n=1 Tax=Leifsonia sp. NPDC077715 TaxID=3155539 RepID=UPI0034151989
MARVGVKGWAAIGLGAALVLGMGIAANASNHGSRQISARETSETVVASPTPTPTPVVEVRTETQDEPIPFAAQSANDANHDVGWSGVTTVGQNGVKTKTFHVTYTDGVETSREFVSEAVTTAPVDQVTSIGTRQPPPPPPAAAPQAPAGGGCDPNYSGACVPIASDVDCAGGSGNGPAYVQGPVTVIGTDIYDLDRDGDGVACE